MKTKEQGFTLVEALIIIVIAGILAVFIFPRFATMEKKIRVAELNSFSANLRSIVNVAHDLSSGKSVIIDGKIINMKNRYPTQDSIERLIDYDKNNFEIVKADNYIQFPISAIIVSIAPLNLWSFLRVVNIFSDKLQ